MKQEDVKSYKDKQEEDKDEEIAIRIITICNVVKPRNSYSTLTKFFSNQKINVDPVKYSQINLRNPSRTAN